METALISGKQDTLPEQAHKAGTVSGKPMVSSIIIFLNTEKFIQEAIESVFAQTYENWELILVDDGSTDSSTKIALRYAEQHPGRVRYVEHNGHENRGMSASRNLGMRNAKGEYVAFLDADDVWLPEKLERQVAILENYPNAAAVFAPWQSWSSWSENPNSPDFTQDLQVQPDRLFQPRNLVRVWLQKEIGIPGHCATLIRRKMAEEVGGFEEAFRDYYEDLVFLTKIHLKAPVFVDSACLSRYRQHPESCCYGQGRVRFAWEIYLNWLEQHLVREKVKDRDIWIALREELRPYRHPTLHRLLDFGRRPARSMKRLLKWIAQCALPTQAQARLLAQLKRYRLRQMVHRVRLLGLKPVRPNFGSGAGQCIDRYYIELFLGRYALDIRGRVLEVQDKCYTRQFGGDQVTHSDVLNVTPGNPQATIIADLASADHIPSETFDCIILTQTLQYIFDVAAGIRTCYRILRPGGVLLVTLPGIQQIDREDRDAFGKYWRFTTCSARRLFAEVFSEHYVTIQAYGNVLSTTAFLRGLVTEELQRDQLNYHDDNYEMLISARARKSRN